MISSLEAIKAISRSRKNALVVATMAPLREWSSVSQHRELDLDLSDCMDKASSVGLGLTLALPDRKVLILDGDAGLRLNLGSLVTIANLAPRNLVHFLFEDDSYLATEGQPIPGLDKIDFASLAKSAGYSRTYQFDNLEEFVIALEEVLMGPGPTFVSLKVVHDQELPPYPSRTIQESIHSLQRTLVGH